MSFTFGQRVRELPRALIWPVWVAACVIVIVGFTGSLVLVIPAAANASLTQAELASWVWAIIVGCGVGNLVLSLVYRQPILVVWSTPGLALLATALAQYPIAEAVGAYIIVGVLIIVIGVSGLFTRLVSVLPQPVALAVLGGLLLKFGLGVMGALAGAPLLVLAMIVAFFLGRRLGWRAPMAGVLVAGVLVAAAQGGLNFTQVQLAITLPIVVMPIFSIGAVINLGLPLLVLALASQNLPGFAVLRAAGYEPPVRGILASTGLLSVLFAPLLAHGFTLAAITAAIGTSPEAHPEKDLRYGVGIAVGILKIALGMFGATIVGVFAALPVELVAAAAGLALSGTILNALTGAFGEPRHRTSALWALLVTASDVTLLGIGSAFWGFVAGIVVYLLLERDTRTPAI